MKNELFLFLILLLVACSEQQPTPRKMDADQIDAVTLPSRYAALLSQFRRSQSDTLWVYSPADLKGEYGGHAIDSAGAVLFPPEIAEKHFNSPPGLFAVYQLPLAPGFTGLLARTPDWYVPNSLKLFYFNHQRDTITSYVELAQRWGDAGDFHRKDAWVFQTRDSTWQALVWFYEEHDNSLEIPSDKTKSIRQSYTLLNLSGSRADTLSKDSASLASRFSHLTRKLAANPY
jgi:hypothetical protein